MWNLYYRQPSSFWCRNTVQTAEIQGLVTITKMLIYWTHLLKKHRRKPVLQTFSDVKTFKAENTFRQLLAIQHSGIKHNNYISLAQQFHHLSISRHMLTDWWWSSGSSQVPASTHQQCFLQTMTGHHKTEQQQQQQHRGNISNINFQTMSVRDIFLPQGKMKTDLRPVSHIQPPLAVTKLRIAQQTMRHQIIKPNKLLPSSLNRQLTNTQ